MKTQTDTAQEESQLSVDHVLVFQRNGDRWQIGAPNVEGRGPKVGAGQSIKWTLPAIHLDFAVLHLNPSYFDYMAGAKMGEEGIVILSSGTQPFTVLKVKDDIKHIPRNFEYTYTALCMNGSGTVKAISQALAEGDVAGLLSDENLTLALSATIGVVAVPPSMIIM